MQTGSEFVDTECTPHIESMKNTIQYDEKSPYPSTLKCIGKRHFLPINVAICEVNRYPCLSWDVRLIHGLMHNWHFPRVSLIIAPVSDNTRANFSKEFDHALIRSIQLNFISDSEVMEICPVHNIDCLEILKNPHKLFVSVQCRRG